MKKAFTLSEVLITLVIIGVVSAVTISALFANYTEYEKREKVKKVYSTLANALTFVKAENGEVYFDDIEDTQEVINEWYDTFLKKQLNTMKVCKGTIEDVKDCERSIR